MGVACFIQFSHGRLSDKVTLGRGLMEAWQQALQTSGETEVLAKARGGG